MQTITGFIYDQDITVNYTQSVTVKNRNETVYARPLTAYRGIDNRFRIKIKNNDQKKVAIGDKTIIFNLVDRANRVNYLTKTATIIAGGLDGLAEVILTENDLLNLSGQYFNWSLVITDGEGNEFPAYVDDNYDAKGTLRLHDAVYPEFDPSVELTFPNMVDFTSGADAKAELNRNGGLHSAQFYFSTYTGDLVIQGTMDSVASLQTANWFDITTLNFTAQVDPIITSWTGVYSGIRFQRVITTGDVTQILYRP
tara:strand:+ start:512 stop:1273 length:762 start_codon:yes stop_codon:yes gene_type:complete